MTDDKPMTEEEIKRIERALNYCGMGDREYSIKGKGISSEEMLLVDGHQAIIRRLVAEVKRLRGSAERERANAEITTKKIRALVLGAQDIIEMICCDLGGRFVPSVEHLRGIDSEEWEEIRRAYSTWGDYYDEVMPATGDHDDAYRELEARIMGWSVPFPNYPEDGVADRRHYMPPHDTSDPVTGEPGPPCRCWVHAEGSILYVKTPSDGQTPQVCAEVNGMIIPRDELLEEEEDNG